MSTYPRSNLGQPSSRDEKVTLNFGAGYVSQLDADSFFSRQYKTDWDSISEITPNGGNYIQGNWTEGFIQGQNELARSQTHMVIGEGGATSSRNVIVRSGGAYDHIHAVDTYQILPSQERISGSISAHRRRFVSNNPFTIEEVEELVQAVETLGTGRWQMIKDEVLLFRNDSRRTPTDLKDKWRTLVNTAILDAERRRSGAAIPEPLLQRVLNAQNRVFH